MGFIGGLLNFLLVVTSLFLICLVLIQRGRGGGLAGAFGGVGGSSAFGTKAGDVFTRVTIVTATVWFLLAIIQVVLNNQGRDSAFAVEGDLSRTLPVTAPAKGGTATPPPAVPGGTGAPAPSGTPAPTDTPPAAPAAPAPAPEASKTDASLPDVFEDNKPAPAPASTPSPAPAPAPAPEPAKAP